MPYDTIGLPAPSPEQAKRQAALCAGLPREHAGEMNPGPSSGWHESFVHACAALRALREGRAVPGASDHQTGFGAARGPRAPIHLLRIIIICIILWKAIRLCLPASRLPPLVPAARP